MFQAQKNRFAMQLAGFGLVLWLLSLYPASTAEAGALKWHPHMHWFDKVVWYTIVAVGPVLAGFLLGVGYGGRKVIGNCKDCGERADVDTMRWYFSDMAGQSGHWRCSKCCERYNQWNEWRKTQANQFSYRNEEERKWARMLWESDPGYFYEDEFWQGPNGMGFPDQPVDR
jgi:hypothetical protein